MEIDEKSDNEKQSDSSDDDDENRAEDLAKVEELEQKIARNVYDYDSHIALISILKDLTDLDKIREARNRMASYFPLTSPLWMEWLVDEIKIATTSEEKADIVKLFERAVKDYLSVDIWLEYVQFNIGLHSEEKEAGIELIRSMFERALTAVGLHVVKGSLLWETYLEFEQMILSMLQSTEGTSSEAIANQQKRIANLFRRQMSCPLLDMDETLERFNTWLVETTGSLDDFKIIDRKFVETTFKTARQKLSVIEKYEEKLLTDPDKYESYKDYLEHEKSKEGSPARVVVLYERALSHLCLHDYVWLEYVEYLDSVLHDGPAALIQVKKAFRNCPWSCKLALAHIRLLEKYHGTHEEVTVAVEQSLATGLQQATDFRDVWMCFLEYVRRRYDAPDISKEEEDKRLKELRAAFEKAAEYISKVDDADPECTILQFWARVEAKIGKDLEKARLLWTEILSDPSTRTAAMWLEYINLESVCGDSKHLRKLFPRALQQVIDWPESIYNAWLNYERDDGTLESYINCVAKCEARIKEMNEKREQERQEAEQSKRHWEDTKRPRRVGLGFNANEKSNGLKNEVPNPRKRKMEDTTSVKGSPEKKTRIDNSSESTTKSIVDSLLKPKDFGAVEKHDSSKDNRTIFISNLDYSTTEDAIREKFTADGKITDLRLVKDFKGRSKGYCYVEFENFESAMKGLKRDRQLIEGRPMFVSKCDPDKETRTGGLRFSTGMEKNKLFIKGLPLSSTIEDLREMFGKYGSLKDVRLVTYRNGHSKGLAYVDYEDEVSAAQAILKADGMTIGDKIISVAISNPPSRQKPETSGPPVASLGGGPKTFGARGKGRTQISFLPRSVQLNSAATKGLENLSIDSPSSTNSQ